MQTQTDTLGIANQLKEAKFTKLQAEAIAKVIVERETHLATKSDIKLFASDMTASINLLRSDITHHIKHSREIMTLQSQAAMKQAIIVNFGLMLATFGMFFAAFQFFGINVK